MLNCYREKRAKTLPETIMMRFMPKKHRKTVFGKSLTINNLQHITQQPCFLRIPKRAFPMYEKARLRLSYGTYGMPGKPIRNHKTCFSATRNMLFHHPASPETLRHTTGTCHQSPQKRLSKAQNRQAEKLNTTLQKQIYVNF